MPHLPSLYICEEFSFGLWFDVRLTIIRSTGITSRGRIGVNDTSLDVKILTLPYFTDPVDKSTLIDAINEVLGSVKHGESLLD